jgi:hypothetical protein
MGPPFRSTCATQVGDSAIPTAKTNTCRCSTCNQYAFPQKRVRVGALFDTTCDLTRATWLHSPTCMYCAVRVRPASRRSCCQASVYCAFQTASVKNAPSLSSSVPHNSDQDKWHVTVRLRPSPRVSRRRREAPTPFPFPHQCGGAYAPDLSALPISYCTSTRIGPPSLPYSTRPAVTRKKENTRYRSHDRQDCDVGHDDHHDNLLPIA